jgi:hypothetical protein
MVISLIAWIYISFICLIWGTMSLSAGPGKPDRPSQAGIPPSLICLAGLAVISTVALLLSLFMPLDWKAHAIILLPVLIYCAKSSNRQTIKTQLTDTIGNLSRTGAWLLFVCIAMVLTISTHSITHPDTTFYHARSILLFERYPAIPGIANLRNELGFQSGWFAALALFKLDSPNYYNIIFLNGAVLCWFLLFIAQKMKTNGWAWLLLLSYTFFSWTQLRLTAASPSPDFIVSLYSWAAFYVFMQKEAPPALRPLYLSLLVLFCIAATLTKLSAIALLPLAIIALARTFRTRQAVILIIYSFLALLLLFIRNGIASGYLLYPLPGTDLFSCPWKMNLSTVTNFQHYISLYARFPIESGEVEKYWQLHFPQWIPRWWDQISFPDRLLLLGILIAMVVNPAFALIRPPRKRLYTPKTGSDSKKYWIALTITLAGSLLWFLGAPSPRFGTGFLVPFFFFLYQPLHPAFLSAKNKFPAFPLAATFMLATIAAYTLYRQWHFSTPSQLLTPAGIAASAYDPLGCENIQVDLLHNRLEIKPGPGHCIEGKGGFSPIGTTIAEGFKPPD